jgi:hypothetical protein
MTEQKSDAMEPTPVESVNTSRRKLTAAALAGPVVLGSLASKRVLADGLAYKCTVSGQVSNTASPRAGETTSCVLGVSPGCWKNKKTSCYKPDGTKRSGCTHKYPSPYTPDTLFSEVFGADPCQTGTTTLWQMLGSGGNSPCSGIDTKFARVCTASLLSAQKWYAPAVSTSYPLSATQVIGLYKIGAGLGGTPFNELFQGVTGTPWTKLQIQTYLESLYGGVETNECPAGGNTP